MSRLRRNRPCRAFTLIELLVVIGIIAILMSMLLPAVRKAKEKGQQGVCLGQMKQLLVAVNLYLDDYDDRVPHIWWNGELFTDRLGSYLEASEIWLCPGGDRSPSVIGTPNGMVLHYGVNHYDYDDVDGDGIDNHMSGLGGGYVRELLIPERAIYLADADPKSSPHNIGGAQNGTTDWPLTSLAEHRHMRGYVVGLLGTSAEWKRGDSPNHTDWALPK